MNALLRGLLSFIITVLAVIFALANRDVIAVTWSPFHAPAALPVFIVVLGGVLIGFITGGAFVWLNAAPQRQQRRAQRRQIRQLQLKLEAAEPAPAAQIMPQTVIVTAPATPAASAPPAFRL